MNHDLHTHSTWSDGKHEISTQIYLARAFQLDGIAFTDHMFPGQKLAAAGSLEAYTNVIEESRKHVDDLVILKGIELMVLDTTGSILLTENEAENFEWILCDIGHLLWSQRVLEQAGVPNSQIVPATGTSGSLLHVRFPLSQKHDSPSCGLSQLKYDHRIDTP